MEANSQKTEKYGIRKRKKSSILFINIIFIINLIIVIITIIIIKIIFRNFQSILQINFANVENANVLTKKADFDPLFIIFGIHT